jgi:hypothetical protein
VQANGWQVKNARNGNQRVTWRKMDAAASYLSVTVCLDDARSYKTSPRAALRSIAHGRDNRTTCRRSCGSAVDGSGRNDASLVRRASPLANTKRMGIGVLSSSD